jgi:excisionase family DNA binding protein
LSGLDEFYRYIEKKETGTEKVAANGTTVEKTGAGATKRRRHDVILSSDGVRYVLRNGITVAVPVADGEGDEVAPLPGAELVGNNEAVLPDRGTPEAYVEAKSTEEDTPWDRLPRHIQLLATIPAPREEEVAQKYYSRGFRETRQELIERLLNPTLTLEETARVLGVCPATVRRYTNRGILPHHRTVGQQRRFRLSDVLTFLEEQQNSRRGEAKEEGYAG